MNKRKFQPHNTYEKILRQFERFVWKTTHWRLIA